MNVDYQDYGMLKAYRLVYQFLVNDIPIHWAIQEGKDFGKGYEDIARDWREQPRPAAPR